MLLSLRARVVLALAVVLVALLGASYATEGFVHDQLHWHHGSRAYADNGADYSLLTDGDSVLWACNNTFNGEPAHARSFNNGYVSGHAYDNNPRDAQCEPQRIGGNQDGHDTGSGSNGFGPNSGHN